jgi:hypothetical protein
LGRDFGAETPKYNNQSIGKTDISKVYEDKGTQSGQSTLIDIFYGYLKIGQEIKCGTDLLQNPPPIFFVIPFYLQPVPVHSANCVKTCIQWHVEECSVVHLCN